MARRLIATRVLVALVFAPGSAAFAQSEHAAPHCAPVEGAGMTNLAVINQATTLGTQTGDLAGAVSVVILSVTPGANGTTVFKVQHHFVTEAGYSITAAPANATVTPVAPGLLAVVSYPVRITGGTGPFAGASGKIDIIGEVFLPNFPDLAGGKTVFRYSGQLCYAAPERK